MFFFFKQKTAYEMLRSLVGSEMCIRDSFLLDLHVDDMVYVEKGGDIIPKIVGVDSQARNEASSRIEFIEKCPECGTEMVRNEGEANHYCPDYLHCPPQLKGRIEHFISRKAMDIDGLGEETVDLLFSEGMIRNVADLYDLTAEQLLPLNRMGEKSVARILSSIKGSVDVPYHRVIFAPVSYTHLTLPTIYSV